ncbi:MAG: trehalose-6-phosphate synthase, partial [Proteobacteria bacterium]|nr:trehalose-6-phosphate synthase [Pseudomonadota bacterium]
EITHQEEVTTLGAFPIGLDVDKILAEVSEGKTLEQDPNHDDLYQRIRNDRGAGRTVFGGLERCDYTKGLLERLGIFCHVLDNLKKSGKDGRFYQITAPSRHENPDYRNLNDLLAKEVIHTNGMLGGEYVFHVAEGISSPQNYRFMKEVDVMLVTPLEDGMNLVAFEYILSQKYKRPQARGFLVLGTSGASRVLKKKGFGEQDGIVYVNTMKAKEAGEKTTAALKKGGRLSERVIDYVVREHRVDDWAERNIEAILNCKAAP